MQTGTYEVSIPPFGYIKDNGIIIIDPQKAGIVKQIYRWYLSGIGMTTIAARLNDLEIPTTKGGKWRHNAVRYILTNEKYIGDALLQKTFTTETISFKRHKNTGEADQYYIRNSQKAIVTKEDFDKVQRLISERSEHY